MGGPAGGPPDRRGRRAGPRRGGGLAGRGRCPAGSRPRHGGGGVLDSIGTSRAVRGVPCCRDQLYRVQRLQRERRDPWLDRKASAKRAPAGAPIQRPENAAVPLVAIAPDVDLVRVGRVEERKVKVRRG